MFSFCSEFHYKKIKCVSAKAQHRVSGMLPGNSMLQSVGRFRMVGDFLNNGSHMLDTVLKFQWKTTPSFATAFRM